MTNLMCRGRKRGLAGVIATQRLAKLAKNVAAEASNFLMGRTFLDIDMARAADLLGMERRQAEVIRDLERGHFLALGPAVSRRPISVRIGEVKTAARSGSPKLVPLPSAAEDMESLLLAPAPEEALPPPPPPALVPAADLIPAPESARAAPSLPTFDEGEQEAIVSRLLRELTVAPGSTFQPVPALYPDYVLPHRLTGLGLPPPPPPPALLPAADLIPAPESARAAPSPPTFDEGEQEAIVSRILRELTEEPGSTFQPVPALYQDFVLRCRMRRLGLPPLDLAGFRRRLAMARAGILDLCEEWEPTLAIGAELPEDILAPFLLVARAAREGSPCPSDEALAEAYGTSSPARVRRLLAWMEERQIIASRTHLSGRSSNAIPRLDWPTAPDPPEPEHTARNGVRQGKGGSYR